MNGFVFARAGGAEALRQKLRDLLDHRERLLAVRAPALARARQFSVSAIADRYLGDFASLLEPGTA